MARKRAKVAKPAKAPKFKQKIGKPLTSAGATTSASKGPAWKPSKATTTGNYGKAVSAAAKARNAARPASPAGAADSDGMKPPKSMPAMKPPKSMPAMPKPPREDKPARPTSRPRRS